MKEHRDKLILKFTIVFITVLALCIYAKDFMEVIKYVFG